MTTKEALEERYGRGSRPVRRRAFWMTVAAVTAAPIAAFSWLTISNALNEVGFDETGYEVVDDRTVAVSFQATTHARRRRLRGVSA